MNLDQNAYKQAYMKAIAKLLTDRCETDPYLDAAVRESDRTLDQIFKYVESQAKKKATGGCAVLTDEEVLEMAVHFVLDENDKPEPEKIEAPKIPAKPVKNPVKKTKSLEQEMADQLTFDF